MQTTASEDVRPPWPWWYGPLGFIAGAVCGFISAGIVWAALGVDDPSESPGAIVAGTVLLDGSLVGAALLFASFVRRPRGWHFGLRRTKFWPAVSRIDNPYGDRNLFCSCPPIDASDL